MCLSPVFGNECRESKFLIWDKGERQGSNAGGWISEGKVEFPDGRGTRKASFPKKGGSKEYGLER